MTSFTEYDLIASGLTVEIARDRFDVTVTVYPANVAVDYDLHGSEYHGVESWLIANGATAAEAEEIFDRLQDMDFMAQDGE